MTYIDINDPSVRNVGVGEAPRWLAKPIRLLLISISMYNPQHFADHSFAYIANRAPTDEPASEILVVVSNLQ